MTPLPDLRMARSAVQSGRVELVRLDDIDSFREARDHPADTISHHVIAAVRGMDEREVLEPSIRAIVTDVGDTPHGPAEIVDIFTHKLMFRRRPTVSAFILKGKSTRTVRPKDVAHQIYRLEKITGLDLAVLGYSGTLLDAAKEHFLATTARLGCRALLLDAVELARLLAAYGFLCPRDGLRIAAGRCKCGYSPSYRILNALQDETLDELQRAHRLRQPKGLVILPPGTGKTRIAAEDANRLGARHVLYLAHTHEILDIAQSEFEAVFGAASVRRHVHRNSLSELGRVNLATVQLLSRDLDALPHTDIDYLAVDEFHHAAAPSYRRLLDRIQPTFLLGLTATPFRGDRQDIVELCDNNVLVHYELRSGVERGVLAPYHYFGCFDDIDYSGIRHNGVQYDVRDLEKALLVPERDFAVLAKWRELAEG
jgi:hypothetical protein